MDLNQANVNNLKSLWEKYGSQVINLNQNNLEIDEHRLKINTHWPFRCWFNNPISLNDILLLKHLPKSTIFPVWPNLHIQKISESAEAVQSVIDKKLTNNHWHCVLEQTAMSLTLVNSLSDPFEKKLQPRIGFTVNEVQTAQDITTWIDIVAEAFGYRIDRVVIERLIDDQNMQILMAHHNGQGIAAAMLYKTNDIIGIHQVGVKLDFQGKGFARTFMEEIIVACSIWKGKHIVLQASEAGKPLYESLGFKSNFLIKSYKQNLG